jgi:hypothetical protein
MTLDQAVERCTNWHHHSRHRKTAKLARLRNGGIVLNIASLWTGCCGCFAARWSDLPERYGKWKSVHKRFTRWAKAGISVAGDVRDIVTSIN